MPQGEWPQLVATVGESLLAEVLGISASSARRYAAQERPTPQSVAMRLHFLALLVADLAGAYNEYGIRRWFTRPRSRLDGKRPADLLRAHFDPGAGRRPPARTSADGCCPPKHARSRGIPPMSATPRLH
jgi:hypothetical protein